MRDKVEKVGERVVEDDAKSFRDLGVCSGGLRPRGTDRGEFGLSRGACGARTPLVDPI